VRGTQQSWVMWNAEALDQMVEAALLRYLAVAHFGRGRGEWAPGESPSHWREATQLAMQPYREGLNTVWRERDAARDEMAEESQVLIAASLQTVFTQVTSDVLRGLYPQMKVLGESAHSELLASQ
jgi:hypothetical protein